jgi:hypothetical protein
MASMTQGTWGATQTPLEQYGQVAANRSAEDNAFYDQQNQQIQNQANAAVTPTPETIPSGPQINSALAGVPPEIPQVNPAGAPQQLGQGGVADPFAAMGGGVLTPDGSWLPRDHPAAQQYLNAPSAQQQLGAGPGGTTGPAGVSGAAPTDLIGAIEAILRRGEGGGLSPDIMNSRVNSARDDMNRARTSQVGTLEAMLSDRGLLGSGPQASGLGRIEEELASIFGQQTQDIYADEAQRADGRFIDALGMLTGYRSNQDNLSSAAADRAVQDALGRANIESGYNLGQGRLGLDRELGLLDAQNDQTGLLLELARILGSNANISAGGFN